MVIAFADFVAAESKLGSLNAFMRNVQQYPHGLNIVCSELRRRDPIDRLQWVIIAVEHVSFDGEVFLLSGLCEAFAPERYQQGKPMNQ